MNGLGVSLFDAGYTDLVSVVPPDGELHPRSKIREADKGKAPAVLDNGYWRGYHWRADEPTRPQVLGWDNAGANIGLCATHFPGIDIDVDDELVTEIIRRAFVKLLGPSPVRLSKPGRALLVYRTEEPFEKMRLTFEWQGQPMAVEVLANGQQYLVAGKHPSGADYRWAGTDLWDLAPDKLTTISRRQVEKALATIAEALEGRDGFANVAAQGDGRARAEAAPEQDDLKAPSIEALVETMQGLANDERFDERDEWVKVLYACKAAGQDDERSAFAAFLEWCSRWENGDNEPEYVAANWKRAKGPFVVGYDYLAELAGRPPAIPAVLMDLIDTSAKAEPTTGGAVSIETTDTWAAAQIMPSLVQRVRNVPALGWLEWNGYKWARDERLMHRHAVKSGLSVVSTMVRNAAKGMDSKDAKVYLNYASSLQNQVRISRITSFVESEPSLTLMPDQVDADNWSINTPAGLVDLRTGKLTPPNPSVLVTKATEVAPATGKPKRFLQYLDETTCGDEDLARYLQKILGYSLTGAVSEQQMWFFFGSTAAGKSVLLNTVMRLLGDYGGQAPSTTFAATKYEGHPTEIANLFGRRLIVADETQAGQGWNEQRIKQVTGGGRLVGRQMRRDFFEFMPTFKLFIVGNHAPEIANLDAAMERRIRVVPFSNFVEPEKRIKDLDEKLIAKEGPQILQWLIDGCLAWQVEGIEAPAAVVEATREYVEEQDMLSRWLDDCATFEEEAEATAGDLYQSYTQYANRRGERERKTQRMLTSDLRARAKEYGITYSTHLGERRSLRGFLGLSIRTEDLVL